jgi:hypothetical protein
MSAAYSQRLTKNYITIQNNGPNGNETVLFLESDFTAWLAATDNQDNLSKVGNLYIVKGARADQVLRGVDGFTELEHNGDNVDAGVVLNDMGGDIRVWSQSTDEAVVFRRVQVPPSITDAGNGSPDGEARQVGYVVVDNNIFNMTRPRFQVTVARV